jgi:magnesium chelatase subunit I
MQEDPHLPSPEEPKTDTMNVPFRSLKELVDRISGISDWSFSSQGDAGLADKRPFPFLAVVGQREMKLALLISLVNPAVGGVLLIGPRGTGKTTAVRSLVDLLPQIPRSLCYHGCMPEDVEIDGIDSICPECAQKYGRGEPLAALDQVRLIELPLNARLEDVVGSIDERAAVHNRLRTRRGILAQADHNLLYIDEVNLLSDDVVDAILDAAAQGAYTVRRGPVSSTFRSRFVLIGSMNPEEGHLRPQIMDRFGLRVLVRGLGDIQDRLEVYKRVRNYIEQPRSFVHLYFQDLQQAKEEIQLTRDILPQVEIPENVTQLGLSLISELHIDSLRAEITMFESARAIAALDARTSVTEEDLLEIAPISLRMRRSQFIEAYFKDQSIEEQQLQGIIGKLKSTDKSAA